jgi:hypothetical protein
MTPDEALKWGASFAMSGGGLLSIYHFIKNAVGLRTAILKNRKTSLDIERLERELSQASSSVRLASLEEMDRLVRTRSTITYSAASRTLTICLIAFLCGAVVWASVDAKQSRARLQLKNTELSQALDRLKKTEEELRQLKTPASNGAQEPRVEPKGPSSAQKSKSVSWAHLELKTMGQGEGPVTIRVFNPFTFTITISIDQEENFSVPAKTALDIPVKAGVTRTLSVAGARMHSNDALSFPAIGGNVFELTFQNDHAK